MEKRAPARNRHRDLRRHGLWSGEPWPPTRMPRARREPEARSAGRWLALAVLCMPLLITSLDNTVLNVALPTLVRKLHATDSELQWIVDAYVLVFGGLMLVSGSLADHVGRKRTFIAGLGVFAACSTWAAFSGSAGVLIAARASMGLGGALIMPSTLSIITNTFTDSGERQRALGIWAGTIGAGVALGPIVGGLLLAHFAWGSVFLINVPIALLALALAIRLVPNSLDPNAQRPDLGGALLSIAGIGLLLWAIIEAPVHGWSSPAVIGAGAAGLLLLAGFVAWEAQTSHPMLKLRFFRERSFSAAVACDGLMMFGLMGAFFALTQFLQFQLGYSALQAGVRMLPAAGGIAVMAPLSPVLIRRLRHEAYGRARPAPCERWPLADIWCLDHHDLRGDAGRHDHARHRHGHRVPGLRRSPDGDSSTRAHRSRVRHQRHVCSGRRGAGRRDRRKPPLDPLPAPHDPGPGGAPRAARNPRNDSRVARCGAWCRRAGGRSRRDAACRSGPVGVPERYGPRSAGRSHRDVRRSGRCARRAPGQGEVHRLQDPTARLSR
jgi:MFS family permease